MAVTFYYFTLETQLAFSSTNFGFTLEALTFSFTGVQSAFKALTQALAILILALVADA